ncbi:hypothetical protein [Arenibaculum pallidiluteum]|uniref:hypothetical protein n=1 Tax=Arenibaculum pallidiluteum TaxID=2812559 RepID=UPI001A97A454|nr:hypothetical protein [Arenibaculum pallidiluteum]
MIAAVRSSSGDTALAPLAPGLAPPSGASDALPDPDKLPEGAGSNGPYYSPVVRLDAESHRTVITFRDVNTGDVTIQYPTERQLEAYRASVRQRQQQEAEQALERIFGKDGAKPGEVPGTAAGGVDTHRDAAGTSGGEIEPGTASGPSAGTPVTSRASLTA